MKFNFENANTRQMLTEFMKTAPSIEDVAIYFETTERKIASVIKQYWKKTFDEFKEQSKVTTKTALERKAIQMALAGDRAMMAFCLKNICGWKEKIEHSGDDAQPITLNYNLRAKTNDSDKIEGW